MTDAENKKSNSENILNSRLDNNFKLRKNFIFREIGEIIRYESKRIIVTQKFFIALTLILLPAILYLDASAREVEVFLVDFGEEMFMRRSAAGFIILGQFLMQMIAIMLTLDSFGKSTNDSMQRYFAMPIRKISIYIGHTITTCIGTAITGVAAILAFDLILWIWTGISLSFVLILQAFFLTFIGAFLAIATTTLFIVIANYFNFTSSIAIVPTLFLFYIIPFVVYFTSQFNYVNETFQNWTFMHQLAVATDFMIQPINGLQEILENNALLAAWLTISLVIAISEIIAAIIFIKTEK
ncbi:MAG: hypothetical protein EAX90_10950 [Candidatus Heimdallarchaeota archaeon]|nr:hypothetical protein [Candidatus Heimdallarchaeota archaeon]